MNFSVAFLDLVIHSQCYEKWFYWCQFSLWSTQEQLDGVREPSPGFNWNFPTEQILWCPSCLGPYSHGHHSWAGSTLSHTQLRDQSFGSLLWLDSIGEGLLLLVLEVSTAILTRTEHQAEGWLVYLHMATQQVSTRAVQELGAHRGAVVAGHAPVEAETF